MRRTAAVLVAALIVLGAAATLIPAARIVAAARTSSPGPDLRAGGPGSLVSFRARDGTTLYGRFVPGPREAPSIVLAAGFKSSGRSMTRYADLLHTAGYNVLLFDGRGIGSSGGQFTLGAREPLDVEGAIRYLERRPDLPVRRYGLLGVSLGAGVVLVAAAHLPEVRAVVADSPWTDQSRLINRMDDIHLHGLTIPILPLAPWIARHVLGITFRETPLTAIRAIPPRSILLIHDLHDTNPTTTYGDALALRNASGNGARFWEPVRGGHSEALRSEPLTYCRHVVGFFSVHLGAGPSDVPSMCARWGSR